MLYICNTAGKMPSHMSGRMPDLSITLYTCRNQHYPCQQELRPYLYFLISLLSKLVVSIPVLRHTHPCLSSTFHTLTSSDIPTSLLLLRLSLVRGNGYCAYNPQTQCMLTRSCAISFHGWLSHHSLLRDGGREFPHMNC